MYRLFLILVATTALGQQKPPADLPLTALERAKLVEAAAARIDNSYVDPAKAKEIAASLRDAAKSGQFDSSTSALQLVPAVNRVLRTSGDLHLRFGYSAEPQPMNEDAPRHRNNVRLMNWRRRVTATASTPSRASRETSG